MRRRRSMVILLLCYIQVVTVGRSGAQVQSDVHSLCRATSTKTHENDAWFHNTTMIFSNASFINSSLLIQEQQPFNITYSFNDTETDCMPTNKTTWELTPAINYEFSWVDFLFVGLIGTSGLVGTVGNAAVILAFCLYRKVRTTANAFIVNTSISDLIVSAVTIPVGIHTLVRGQPSFGEACCAFIGFLHLSSISQSMLSCVLIAFNRYVHVVWPVNTYKRLFGPVKAFAWVVGACVITVVFISPAIAGIYGSLGWDENWGECQLSSADPKSPVFYRDVLGPAYWIVMLGISAFYIRIYLHVRQSGMAIGRHLGHSPKQVSLQAVKRTKHMFYIFITFFTLTTPCLVTISVDPYGTSLPKAALVTVFSLFYWNTAVNPIIYTWTLKEFRLAFKCMIRCRRNLALPAPKPTVVKPKRVANVLSRLTVSNRVDQAGPTMPVVAT